MSGLFDLTNQTIVVSGGSGQIGLEVVQQLLYHGSSVVVGVRNVARFEDLAKNLDLPNAAAQVTAYALNIANADSIRRFVSEVEKNHGRIHGFVSCAWPRRHVSIPRFGDVEPEMVYKELIEHAGGYFLCCQEVANHMRNNGGGSIVNLGSIYGSVAPDFSIYEGTEMTSPGTYAMIKGGVHAITRYMASYLSSCGIRVNCVSPGGVRNDELQHPTFQKAYARKTMLGRMAEPGDISGPVIFLLSNAARYITGAILYVDGGLTAW